MPPKNKKSTKPNQIKDWNLIKKLIKNFEKSGLEFLVDKNLLDLLKNKGEKAAKEYVLQEKKKKEKTELPLLEFSEVSTRKRNNPKGSNKKEIPDEQEEDDGQDPRDTPPPTIHGEEIDDTPCPSQFVRGITNNDCDPKEIPLDDKYIGEFCYLVFPESKWSYNQGAVNEELWRARKFFEKYCIYLNFKKIQLSPRNNRNMVRWYNNWYGRLVNQVGGASHIGTTTIDSGLVTEFTNFVTDRKKGLEKLRRRNRCKCLILFSDLYLSKTPRLTLGSANYESVHQIGITKNDMNSPDILSHELVHALGKSAPNTSGVITWDHNSPCQNAITTVQRDRWPGTIDLSGRFLEKAEYDEIIQNRGGVRILTKI